MMPLPISVTPPISTGSQDRLINILGLEKTLFYGDNNHLEATEIHKLWDLRVTKLVSVLEPDLSTQVSSSPYSEISGLNIQNDILPLQRSQPMIKQQSVRERLQTTELALTNY